MPEGKLHAALSNAQQKNVGRWDPPWLGIVVASETRRCCFARLGNINMASSSKALLGMTVSLGKI